MGQVAGGKGGGASASGKSASSKTKPTLAPWYRAKDAKSQVQVALEMVNQAKSLGWDDDTVNHLQGKLDGMALRVPVVDGSIVDLVATVEKEVSIARRVQNDCVFD